MSNIYSTKTDQKGGMPSENRPSVTVEVIPNRPLSVANGLVISKD